MLLMKDIGVALKRLDIDDHNLKRIVPGEGVHVFQLAGIIYERLERRVVVERAEMLPHHLDALEHALADRDARHDDDEFLEAISLVQFKDSAQIDVGFARAGFHLDGKIQAGVVRPLKPGRHFDAVSLLDGAHILKNLLVPEGYRVADGEFRMHEAKPFDRPADLEAGLRDRLAVKDVEHRIDRMPLIFQRRVKLQLHRVFLPGELSGISG